MRICVVTLYKSMNSGSYWQAYALSKFLKDRNNQVFFFKINYNFISTIKPYLIVFKKLFVNGFTECKNYIKTINIFSQKQKELDIKGYEYVIHNADLVVLGSDTIWNIESKNLLFLKDVFWGKKFKGKRIFSYAASVANTSFDNIISFKDLKEDLINLDYISVRDKHTYYVISKIIDREVKIVCDPTFLLDRSDYALLVGNRKMIYKYIFIYLFDNLSSVQEKELKIFAKRKNLKIVSGTKNFSWCDECILNEPDSFLNGMYYADYIVTDTFHGSVFSVNFNKNFIVINREKRKVYDFLERVGLVDRISVKDDISFLLNSNINYNEKKEKIISYKNHSTFFLNEVLNSYEDRT